MKVFFLVIGIIVGAVATVAAVSLFEAWAVMIVLGILWGEFHWLAPIGLLPAWGLVTLGVGVLATVGRAWHADGSRFEALKDLTTQVKAVPSKVSTGNPWN